MSTLTTIQGTDLITNSRADINNNFSALNSDKIETSVLDTDSALTANSDAKIPSQKAVKAYVDAGGNVNASTLVKGIVEEATLAEAQAGTEVGATGARLFVSPSSLVNITQNTTIQTFLSSGTYTKPTGVRHIFVQAWGGGGSGGSYTGQNAAGGGGGGYFEKWIQASEVAATETVTIGNGGAARTGNTAGEAGGNTTFGSLVTAYGGSGGSVGVAATTGGNGGDIQVGGTLFRGLGASAAAGGIGVLWGGAAGGGVTDATTGHAGGTALYGGGGGGGSCVETANSHGAGGVSIYGGSGGAAHATAGVAGSVPGGGGGGSGNGTSGAGGAGRVIVTEYYV